MAAHHRCGAGAAVSLGKYVDRVDRITAWLGDVRVGSLRVEQVASWQSTLLETLGAKTVADTRATFRSLMEEALRLSSSGRTRSIGSGRRRLVRRPSSAGRCRSPSARRCRG